MDGSTQSKVVHPFHVGYERAPQRKSLWLLWSIGHIWRCIAVIIENDRIELNDTSAFKLFFIFARVLCSSPSNELFAMSRIIWFGFIVFRTRHRLYELRQCYDWEANYYCSPYVVVIYKNSLDNYWVTALTARVLQIDFVCWKASEIDKWIYFLCVFRVVDWFANQPKMLKPRCGHFIR